MLQQFLRRLEPCAPLNRLLLLREHQGGRHLAQVTLGVWQATGAQDLMGKIFGVFFPVLAFVAIGRHPLLPALTPCQLKSYAGEWNLYGTDCRPHLGQRCVSGSLRWGRESLM